MLASLADAPLDDPQLVYEPKYDGIRAIAEIDAEGRGAPLVAPRQREDEAVPGDRRGARRRGRAARTQPLVLDGEIVALDAKGEPTGFQQLQGRIHLTDASGPSRPSRRPPRPSSPASPASRVAFIAFDILREGRPTSASGRSLERRAALERVFGRTGSPIAPDQRSGAAATAARCTSARWRAAGKG